MASFFREALLNFQKYAGLPETGVLDAATKNKMTQDRCEVSDTEAVEEMVAESKGFANFERRHPYKRWKKRLLTYRVYEYTKRQKLTKKQIDEKIREAFKMWSDVANIDFQEITSGEPDIIIK